MIDLAATIRRLTPNGLAWIIPAGAISDLLDGLAKEPARIQEFFFGIVRESNPGTAIDTLEEWFQMYAIRWSPEGAVSTKQATALQRFISTGGQDIVYLQNSLDVRGYDVIIVEGADAPATVLFFEVTGDINTADQAADLAALIQRLSPAHCAPVYNLTLTLNVYGAAQCGTGYCSAT